MPDQTLAAGVTSTASPIPDQLIAGNADQLIARKAILAAGQNLARGALLGKVTSGGAYVISLSAAVDGSQTPVAVLAHDTDATGAAAETLIYERGDFNQSAVTFGTGHTAESVRAGLRALGIFFVKPY